MKSLVILLAAAAVGLTGCGAGSPNCIDTDVLLVGPATATANHAAAAPGNQTQFGAAITIESTAGCAVPALSRIVYPVWTSPDAASIAISSAADATNGLATCKAATSGAVTLTATETEGTKQLVSTVQLTCE